MHHASWLRRADPSRQPVPALGSARAGRTHQGSPAGILAAAQPEPAARRHALGHHISRFPVHRPVQRQAEVIQRVRIKLPDGSSLDTDHLDSRQLDQHEEALAANGKASKRELWKLQQAKQARTSPAAENLDARRRRLERTLAAPHLAKAASTHVERSYHATARDQLERTHPTPRSDAKGFVVPLFTGTHFPKNLDEATYKERTTKRQRTGQATYAPAAEGLAKEAAQDKDAAAESVRAKFLGLKQGDKAKQWWGKRDREFDSRFEAHQQRYVNTFGQAEKEHKSSQLPTYRDLRAGGIKDIPLVSTSEDPKVAVKFAKGVAERKQHRRTAGTQGTVSTFLLSPGSYRRHGGFSVLDAHRKRAINVKPRYLGQHEVNFPGSIRGPHHVRERAVGREKPETVATDLTRDVEERARESKRVIAYPRGPRRLIFERENTEKLRDETKKEAARQARAKAAAQIGYEIDSGEEAGPS